MDYELTALALEQLRYRNIPREWLEMALDAPEQIIVDDSSYQVRQRRS